MSDINSGLLNDVLIVGNELSGKLNEIGISNTFGKASEGKDDLISLIRMAIDGIDMAVDTNSYVSLTATNPYMLTGETTDIVAKLRNGVCRPLTNKIINIGQPIFKDNGTITNHNEHWYINSYGTATVQSNGTKLLNTNETGNFVMRSIIPSDKTITEANSYFYNPSYIVEFDIIETDDTSNSNAQVQIYSNESQNNFAQALTTGHYKIEVKEDEQKIWVDDTLIKTTNLSLPNARITLRARNGKYLIYKNFVVYEIINGVTNENGEFALNNISVTDDATFTATYLNISATCTVYGGVVFYDNATSQSKNTHWKIRTSDQSDITATVGTAGTTLTNVFTSSSRFYFANPNDSTSESPPITISDFVVEADILDSSFIDSDSQIAFLLQGQTNALNLKGYTAPYHIKIEKKGTNVNHYIDDTLIRTTTISDRTNYYMGFQLYKRASVTFRNYVIREI